MFSWNWNQNIHDPFTFFNVLQYLVKKVNIVLLCIMFPNNFSHPSFGNISVFSTLPVKNDNIHMSYLVKVSFIQLPHSMYT